MHFMYKVAARLGNRLVLFLGLLLLLVFAGNAAAQGSSLYVYPLKNQNQEKQDRDRYECHSWAVQQTGYDPSRAYPNNSHISTRNQVVQRSRAS
jgi:spermidine/putrescine-binding protein